MPQLTPDSRLVASSQQLSSELGEGSVILNLSDGTYFGLDEVGTLVWRMVQRPCSVAEIRDRVLDEFEAEPERCTADLLALLEDMRARGLVVEADEGRA